jgi:hypothetical protein
MICFAEPVLIEDLCILQKEEFSITCLKCGTLDERQSICINGKHVFPWERMFHKDYYRKGSAEKKTVRESQRA